MNNDKKTSPNSGIIKLVIGIITVIIIIAGGYNFMSGNSSDNKYDGTGVIFDERVETPTADSNSDAQTPAEQTAPAEQPTDNGNFSFNDKAGNPISLNVIPDITKDKSYVRSDFGKAWDDVDGNGCDTRNDILARDLNDITMKNKCQVATGTLVNDIYTGENIEFVRGEEACDKTGWNGAPLVYNGNPGGCSTAVTIDHVISLEEVWYLMGNEWDFEQRRMFANDPDNLVSTGANSWKSSKTPAEIISDPKSPMTEVGQCSYLTKYIQVVKKYNLPTTETNAQAIAQVYPTCNA